MNSTNLILLYSLIMCISSYLSGLIPLSFNIDLKNLKFISILSVGILISTSFIIIIPESIETLNSNKQDEKSIGIYLLIGFTTLFVLDRVGNFVKDFINHNYSNVNNSNVENDYSMSNFEIDDDDDGARHDDDESTLRPTSSSSLGFVNPFTNFSGSSDKRPFSHIIKSVFQSTNTVGLMIHSITDGIALASSFLSSGNKGSNSSSSSFVIIIAIFLHKLPTAFALTSIMLESKNYSKREIRYHLLFFSISAPIGAILILLINLNLSELSGVLLSISGGSFIFVGFHSLHEMINRLEKNSKDKSILESSLEFLLCLVGLFIPVLISAISKEDV
ncbi:unnamed protein product [[Candida] boidinii]|uniref:Unnamed protein product n=1 Tax=Candida boidinii TaxID=5477 RepID=A0A9W6WI81_CANBO|nr:unnamed protein product [[Candida] boidinii]GMF50428.1 unnamed protein product [[Candida] boidinii]